VYHDVFYGAFKGRTKIAEMWTTGSSHRARLPLGDVPAVTDGNMLYAYYTFSYVSTCPKPRASASASMACRS